MFSKQLLQSSNIRLALIALVLCGITLVGSRSTGQVSAAAVPNAPLDQVFVTCTVAQVAIISNFQSPH